MKEYKRATNTDNGQSSYRTGDLTCTPRMFASTFGKPDHKGSGDGKVDREWRFEDAKGGGETFWVYAYKATNQYHSDLPSPKEFWESDRECELSISSRGIDPSAFHEWAMAKMEANASKEKEKHQEKALGQKFFIALFHHNHGIDPYPVFADDPPGDEELKLDHPDVDAEDWEREDHYFEVVGPFFAPSADTHTRTYIHLSARRKPSARNVGRRTFESSEVIQKERSKERQILNLNAKGFGATKVAEKSPSTKSSPHTLPSQGSPRYSSLL